MSVRILATIDVLGLDEHQELQMNLPNTGLEPEDYDIIISSEAERVFGEDSVLIEYTISSEM